MVFDILIKNGKIVDGKGNPWFKGDIAIKDDFICKIGKIDNVDSREVIDAENMIVCPGFIDVHTHSDFVFFVDPKAQSKVRQGVTTEVLGNCGMSAAPYIRQGKEVANRYSYDIEPWWETVQEFIEALIQQPKTLNVAPLVGHNTLRAAVVGLEDRAATNEELEEMKKMLDNGLKAGALGMSAGLYFTPGSFAPRSELIELGKVIAKNNAVFSSHIWDEGYRTVGLMDSIKGIIDIGHKAAASLNISHIKAIGPEAWGQSVDVLELMEEARAGGLNITADQYPYIATGGRILADVIPAYIQNGKTTKEIIVELKNPEVRQAIKPEVLSKLEKRGGAENQIIANYDADLELTGKSLMEISNEWGIDPAETVMDMLIANNCQGNWTSYSLQQSDVDNFMKYSGTMVCSDGSSLSTEGPLSHGNPHPRNFGTFPHVLKKYVKERGILKLEDAIRKMTSLPAGKFSISKRGCIDEGYWADIVILDYENIKDAGFDKPKQYPEGIPYVMVNGKWVIKEGQYTESLPGRVARRK